MKRAGLLLALTPGLDTNGRTMASGGACLEPALGRRRVRDPVLEWRRGAVAFAIDTHDCEILAWTASPPGIGGIAVRDLMLLAVERRFGTLVAPQPVEWLADNGSCFTANETLAFARAVRLGRASRRSAAQSFNGIAKALVKTF